MNCFLLLFISYHPKGFAHHRGELWSNAVIQQKVDYIHNNPVEAGLVFRAEDYMYSSAVDYSGEKGLLDSVLVFKNY
jgi:hypothetical protein